MEIRAKHGEDA